MLPDLFCSNKERLAQVLHGAASAEKGQVHVFALRKAGGAKNIVDKIFIEEKAVVNAIKAAKGFARSDLVYASREGNSRRTPVAW